MQKFVFAIFFLVALSVSSGTLAVETILPSPTNFQHDAKMATRDNQPIVILFTLPGCAYCKEVREQYLAPILREHAAEDRPLIREVDITSKERFTGFSGEMITHSEFASRFKVKAAPTVVFLDEHGNQVADPLVGAGMAGFYGAYLDQALEASRKVLKKHAHYQQPSALKAKLLL